MTVTNDLVVGSTEPAWSDLKGEISRKVTDVTERLVFQHNDGEISERELRLAIDAVFDCLQGLMPRDVEATLYELSRELTK